MSLDPWRTLGLAPGAGEAEIKRAYRRLAKEHHPDAGGSAALPRFLAIQSAYEMLISGRVRGAAHRSGAAYGSRRSHEGAAPGGQPWSADPARARATRESWGQPGGRRRWGGQGAAAGQAGGSGDHGGSASADRPADGAGGRTGDDGDPAGTRPAGRARPRTQRTRKATPGSTTYDEARLGPDEPGWTGSSWYGQASGTYWTINPREYADPRKHGPDYQARARRATGAPGAPEGGGAARSGWGSGSTSAHSAAGSGIGAADAASAGSAAGAPEAARAGRDPRGGAAPGFEPTGAPAVPRRTTPGGPAATGPDRPIASRAAPDTAPTARAQSGAPRSAPPRRRRAVENGEPVAAGYPTLPGLARQIVRVRIRPATRMGLALAAWPPLGMAALITLGELTGCARAAAACPGPGQVTAWSLVLQVVILVALAAAPTLARLGAVGTLSTVIATVPVVALLTALGAPYAPDHGPAALLGLLGLAYLGGAVIAWNLLRGEEPAHPDAAGGVGSPT